MCDSATPTIMIALLLLLAGCTGSSRPPLAVSSHQPVQLARERGYVACVTALHRALPEGSRYWLQQRYRSKVDEEENVRVFHLTAWMLDQDERREVHFVCTTERFGRTRVQSLSRLRSFEE